MGKFLIIVALVAIAVYLMLRQIERRRALDSHPAGGVRPSRRIAPPRKPTRQVAPDDDEAFLRELDRKRREQDGETS